MVLGAGREGGGEKKDEGRDGGARRRFLDRKWRCFWMRALSFERVARPRGCAARGRHSFGRFWTNCQPKRPLTQRWPFVTSWSSGEVTRTISLSCTRSWSVQPTPQ